MPVQSILGPDGKELPFDKPGTKNCKEVVKPPVANGVASIMTSVLTGNGTAARSALDGGRVAAGKTGTTDKNNETWFVGYTPQLTTAVWVGTPLGNSQALDNVALPGGPYKTVFGASIAAPTWKAIMDYALAGQPNVGFPAPTDQVANGTKVSVPSVSGQTVANATNALQAAGFAVTVGRRVYSNYRPGHRRLRQPRRRGQPGSQITLYISAGPAPQPQQPQPQQPQPQQPQPQPTAATTSTADAPGWCRQQRQRRERERERWGRYGRSRLAPGQHLPDGGRHPAAVGASGDARLDRLHHLAHLRHTRRAGLLDRLA